MTSDPYTARRSEHTSRSSSFCDPLPIVMPGHAPEEHPLKETSIHNCSGPTLVEYADELPYDALPRWLQPRSVPGLWSRISSAFKPRLSTSLRKSRSLRLDTKEAFVLRSPSLNSEATFAAASKTPTGDWQSTIRIALLAFTAMFMTFFACLLWLQYSQLHSLLGILYGNHTELPTIAKVPAHAQPHGPSGKLGFLTFLAEFTPEVGPTDQEDLYYTSTRILAYQFKHDPATRTDLDFVVAVSPQVEQEKRDRLRRDGAVVVEIPEIKAAWSYDAGRWQHMVDKLAFFTFYDYDRLCYLDADSILRYPMDGIFDDSAAQVQQTRNVSGETKPDEAPLPKEYVFASHGDSYHPSKRDLLNRRSQDANNPNYFNGGFWVFKPSKEVFDYYMSLLPLNDRYPTIYGEQAMLNYAHRRTGNLPWATLKWDWNVFSPSEDDFHLGVKSLHAHLWDGNWPFGNPGDRHKFWVKKRFEMEELHASEDGVDAPKLTPHGMLFKEGEGDQCRGYLRNGEVEEECPP